MSATVEYAPAQRSVRPGARRPARIALLGLGRIGRAVAELLRHEPGCLGHQTRVIGALVRDPSAHVPAPCPVSGDAGELLAGGPDVLVEVLGGVEPARTIVLEALARRIPVVTANKSLLAACADELLEAADRSGVALRCEASVLAGVPFLGTFAARPLAAAATGVAGILNGTTNFLLTRLAAGFSLDDALHEAGRLGLVEPDPAKDLDGTDAAEKLALLIRQFGGLRVRASDIPSTPLDLVVPADLEHARALGGVLKPVSFAAWDGDVVSCATGPAFLHGDDPLSRLDGVLNGIRVERRHALPLHFTGPGAGPDVTARTILDDVCEVLAGTQSPGLRAAIAAASVSKPSSGAWFVRLCSPGTLPDPVDVADLLGAHGIWVRRWGARDTRSGSVEQRLVTFPGGTADIESALRAVRAASGCATTAVPVVETGHE